MCGGIPSRTKGQRSKIPPSGGISQCQIEIDNVLGQCNYLDEISFSQNVPITIDANLSAGIYIVTISNNGKKLISQKIYAY